MKYTVETLTGLGFQKLSVWSFSGTNSSNIAYGLNNIPSDLRAKLDEPSALYAFVQDEEVKYIGKTARSIKKRFVGYCNPASTQVTNKRCSMRIKDGLTKSKTTTIYIFVPISDLQYRDFAIDLAAALKIH